MELTGKSVLLCVTGSIAAYKAAELTRLLVKGGASVRVAMSRSAKEFVGPMTFEALTGHPVFTDVFAAADGPVDRYSPQDADKGIAHIDASKKPDVVLIAPATADVIGRLAGGLADDVITTSVLAAAVPVVIAPAMNQRMWGNPIVQENVERLVRAGHHILPPGVGSLACGEVGPGRMMEPEAIVRSLPRFLKGAAGADLSGKRILVCLGRTEEIVDPVRVLTNRSSGKMGVAIVEAALAAGADVSMVAGPTSVPLPEGVPAQHVRTAEEMLGAVTKAFDACDALVMVAAVADYRAATQKPHKMSSGEKRAKIDLEPTEDILKSLRAKRKHQVVVGFALETQAEEQNGQRKLSEKALDMIVVNNPLKEGAAIGSDTNRVTFLFKSGAPKRFPVQSKAEVGVEIVRELESLLKGAKGRAAAAPAPASVSDQPERADRSDRPDSVAPGARGRSRRRRPPRKRPPGTEGLA